MNDRWNTERRAAAPPPRSLQEAILRRLDRGTLVIQIGENREKTLRSELARSFSVPTANYEDMEYTIHALIMSGDIITRYEEVVRKRLSGTSAKPYISRTMTYQIVRTD